MVYVISFMEGVITFVSPCLLPMIPLYLSYLAGLEGPKSLRKNALAFVLGFTIVFMTLGAFAGSLGAALRSHQVLVNVISGLLIILLGLNYLGVLAIPWMNQTKRLSHKRRPPGFWSSLLFGIVFAIGWTPCIGAFLGSALILAASQGGFSQGLFLLFCYSLGLALPFLLSALVLDRLRGAFAGIQKHYKRITFYSGLFLVLMGLLIMTGLFGRLLSFLAF